MSNTGDKNSLKQSKDVKTVIQVEKNTEEETFTKNRLAYLEHKLALLESVQQKNACPTPQTRGHSLRPPHTAGRMGATDSVRSRQAAQGSRAAW